MGEVLQVPFGGGGRRVPGGWSCVCLGGCNKPTNSGGRWLEEASPLIWAVTTLPLAPGLQAGL